jgi:hypothetical protein
VSDASTNASIQNATLKLKKSQCSYAYASLHRPLTRHYFFAVDSTSGLDYSSDYWDSSYYLPPQARHSAYSHNADVQLHPPSLLHGDRTLRLRTEHSPPRPARESEADRDQGALRIAPGQYRVCLAAVHVGFASKVTRAAVEYNPVDDLAAIVVVYLLDYTASTVHRAEEAPAAQVYTNVQAIQVLAAVHAHIGHMFQPDADFPAAAENPACVVLTKDCHHLLARRDCQNQRMVATVADIDDSRSYHLVDVYTAEIGGRKASCPEPCRRDLEKDTVDL